MVTVASLVTMPAHSFQVTTIENVVYLKKETVVVVSVIESVAALYRGIYHVVAQNSAIAEGRRSVIEIATHYHIARTLIQQLAHQFCFTGTKPVRGLSLVDNRMFNITQFTFGATHLIFSNLHVKVLTIVGQAH